MDNEPIIELPLTPPPGAAEAVERPPQPPSAIMDVFVGQFVNRLTCSACHAFTDRDEVFQSLSLSLKGCADVDGCIRGLQAPTVSSCLGFGGCTVVCLYSFVSLVAGCGTQL